MKNHFFLTSLYHELRSSTYYYRIVAYVKRITQYDPWYFLYRKTHRIKRRIIFFVIISNIRL